MSSSVTSGGAAAVVIGGSSFTGGEPLAFDATGGPRESFQSLGCDRVPTADACAERAGVEPNERLVDEHQLVVGTVAQREVPLLGEHLAGRRGLRSVGHLAWRDDRLADLVEQPVTFGFESRANGVEIGGSHPSMVCQPYTPREYHHEEKRMAIEIDPVCGMSVDTTTSQLSLEHDGVTYWFCGKGCLLDFQDDPEAFLASDASPSMPSTPSA
jgi:YHS domain-containing protein